ncbi:heme exporter protein D [Lutimaribacter pacificus]|uniref:Heme exporter protein D n=1 Tax=Lutimaribacter pacificus TaxID=391948 RepID=A0A1H0ASC6_9RHOB|nr:heme exporter protein CcmD [Lutimaribacter pacificus]SDN35956.1 heme exporter protein D [Lutimaribacter pacificus]SHJ65990.1 heme exporter protein D [Lutimaribacter pacificus]
MMPELGKYAGAVLSSYGISLALLLLLVAVSVRRARRMRRELEEVEKRIRRNG